MSKAELAILIRAARDDKVDLVAARSLLQETFDFHAQVASNQPSLQFRPAAQTSYLNDCLSSIQQAAQGITSNEQAFLAWQTESHLFGLKAVEKPVGLVMVRIQRDYYYTTEFYGYVEQLIVSKQARNLGIGPKLLDAACAWLLSRQIHTATLKVYGPNLNALRFYQREGFEPLRHELVKHF